MLGKQVLKSNMEQEDIRWFKVVGTLAAFNDWNGPEPLLLSWTK